MLDPFKDKELEKRDEDLPKPSMKNATDRKIIITIVVSALVLLVIAAIIIPLVVIYM